MKTLPALATMALALILPATTGAATVGTTTVHSRGASLAKGVAKAYRFTPPSTGQADRLNVYLDGASTASRVEVGLYSGSESSAATRRGWCVISRPQAKAWNRCSFTDYSIRAGAYYWLALLHPSTSGGKLEYREGQISGAPASYLSRSRSLPSLPSTWTNASRSSGAYQASIYADQAPPQSDSDGDGVPDSSDQCPGTPAGTPVDANGCPTTLPPPTPTPEPPSANLSVTPNPAVWGQPTRFTSTSSCEDTPCTYRWFHGGATSTDEIEAGASQPNTQASFTYTSSSYWFGPGNITLRVTDASGDMDTQTRTFQIVSITNPDPVPNPDPDPVPPPSGGFPNASNTGPTGTLTSSTGNVTISTAGAVLENRDISGCVTVNAPSVTIRNSRIRCAGASAIWSGSTGLVVEDTEVDCLNVAGRTAITPSNYTARRVDASRCENILWASSNVLVEDSYIHDPVPCCTATQPHTDSIQSPAGANNVMIRHNTVYGGYLSQSNFGNAAITSGASPGTGVSNYIVENNLLAGGGYTVYCPGNVSPTYRLTNNRFSTVYVGKVGGFGPLYQSCNDDNLSGSVYHETGAPLD